MNSTVNESVKSAMLPENGNIRNVYNRSRRYWRNIAKRNGGHKLNSLRSHRLRSRKSRDSTAF